MAVQTPVETRTARTQASRDLWLRKHADYQRVYREGKRQSLPLMTYFFAPRSQAGMQPPVQERARVGLTTGKVLGNAVRRNRIKRRMREAVRRHGLELGGGVDVILHPRRAVLEAEFSDIERDVVRAFRAAQSWVQAGATEKTSSAGA